MDIRPDIFCYCHRSIPQSPEKTCKINSFMEGDGAYHTTTTPFCLISALAEDLTKEFGKNYSKRNLHYYIKFYQCFPDNQIVNACVHNLNWTHIRSLLRVADENARYWYMKEAIDES